LKVNGYYVFKERVYISMVLICVIAYQIAKNIMDICKLQRKRGLKNKAKNRGVVVKLLNNNSIYVY